MKKITFFVRILNDFDHILPIIDFFKEKGDLVEVYGVGEGYKGCLNHISYLKKTLDIDIKSFEDESFSNLSKRLISLSRRNFKTADKGKLLSFLMAQLNNILNFALLIKPGIEVHKFLKNGHKESIYVADFGTEAIFPYRDLIKYSHRMNRRIYAIMHGYNIFTNLDPVEINEPSFFGRLIKSFENLFNRKNNVQIYDKYLVGMHQRNTYFRSNMYKSFEEKNLNKVFDIGIPRYTYEWNKKFILPSLANNKPLGNCNKIKVVLFLSNAKFRVKIDLLNKMIESLKSIDSINLLIKPHPRSGASGLLEQCKTNIVNNDSNSLIDYSDICISYGSSIAFQTLIAGKTLVVPNFVDSNKNIFSENNIGFNANSLEDLLQFVTKYKKENKKINSKKQLDDFILEYIYGGNISYNSLMNCFYSQIL